MEVIKVNIPKLYYKIFGILINIWKQFKNSKFDYNS